MRTVVAPDTPARQVFNKLRDCHTVE
jgi:hypothetical protein